MTVVHKFVVHKLVYFVFFLYICSEIAKLGSTSAIGTSSIAIGLHELCIR